MKSAIIAVIREVLAVVQAAMEDWSTTARLCVIVIVVAATTCVVSHFIR